MHTLRSISKLFRAFLSIVARILYRTYMYVLNLICTSYRGYLNSHDSVGRLVSHPVNRSILTTPQFSVISIILKIIDITFK